MSKFLIYIEESNDDGYIASCPSFPDCVSHGETAEEAVKALKYAISGYIASLRKHLEPVPNGIEDRFHRVELVKI